MQSFQISRSIDRIDKIVVSAVKQSHKAWKPVVNELQNFKDFITAPRNGRKFICHCYEEIEKKDFFAEISKSCPADDSAGAALEGADDITVLVGPEGDFSIDEVRLALENGYVTFLFCGQHLYIVRLHLYNQSMHPDPSVS